MAQSHLESQIIELKDMAATLNKAMKALQESPDSALAREEESAHREQILREQVAYLTDKLYGTSSEKTPDIDGQLSLFNEAEAVADDSAPESMGGDTEETETVTFTRKKKAANAERFADLPVEKRYIDIPEDGRVCDVCGSPLDYVGDEYVRSEIEFVPPKVKKVEYYRRSYECRACKKETGIPHVIKGRDGKFRMVYGMASASTVAWVVYQKYVNSIPLYRQEKEWGMYGCAVTRGTLANWVIRNSEAFFKPMCGLFKAHIKSRGYAMADETPVQVLHENGRSPQSKSYMWVFRTGEFLDRPAIVYQYEPTRAGYVADEFFQGFDGYLMCDGFSGYNVVSGITRTGCRAHARRYLPDAVPKKSRLDYSIPAVQGAVYIDKLFEQERKIHRSKRTADEIRKLRLRDEKPILEGLWSWLEKQSPAKGTKFYKAVIYLRNQRPYLEAYLEDGYCSFSNNASERCCKDFVVGRKNWLFSDTPKGADASAYAYSVIQTAKANNVNPYHYLCFLLEKAPSERMSNDELDQFAPWNEDVKAEIKRREQAALEQK